MGTRRPEWIASGERVREARDAAGMTKVDVKVAIGLDPTILRRIETGEAGLSAEMRGRLATAFSIAPESLGEPNTKRGGHGFTRINTARRRVRQVWL